MKVEIKRLGVLRTGVILAALYGLMAVIMFPFMIIATLASTHEGRGGEPVMMLCMLILYPVMGFIGGIIMAALYNLIVKATGGMQLELDVEPVGQQAGAITSQAVTADLSGLKPQE